MLSVLFSLLVLQSLDALPQQAGPKTSLMRTHGVHLPKDGYAYMPDAPKVPTPDEDPNSDPGNTGPPIKMQVFALTIDRNKDRVGIFQKRADKLGYNITMIQGVDYHKFYPSSSELAKLNLTKDEKIKKKKKAMENIFEAFGKLGGKGADTVLPSGFKKAASDQLSPGQLAAYLGHRHFWNKASSLPNDVWAVLFEDDAQLLAGPSTLRDLLKQSEDSAVKFTGAAARVVYLKPCAAGHAFWQYYMRDAMGYALKADVAANLLLHAHGDVPVHSAIKEFTQGGMCAPIIKDGKTAVETSAGAQVKQVTPLDLGQLTVNQL